MCMYYISVHCFAKIMCVHHPTHFITDHQLQFLLEFHSVVSQVLTSVQWEGGEGSLAVVAVEIPSLD